MKKVELRNYDIVITKGSGAFKWAAECQNPYTREIASTRRGVIREMKKSLKHKVLSSLAENTFHATISVKITRKSW